ncbi:MAG: hypothetical protein AB1585_21490 [Thermodesulfobacteriota bacterium]
MTRYLNPFREILAIAVISTALCVMVYNQAKIIAPLAKHNLETFISFNQEVRFGYAETDIGLLDLEKDWRPRILSLLAGSLATRPAFLTDNPATHYPRLIGLYSAVWLGLTFFLLLLTFGREALFPILGTFAAVAFAYMPGMADRIYPWDLPSLFFFTLFVCLLHRQRLNWFLLVLPLAVLFKETAVVLTLAYLFRAGTGTKRLLYFAAAAALAFFAKLSADLLTDSLGRFTLDTGFLKTNVRYLIRGTFPYPEWYPGLTGFSHPLFLNAGLLLAFFLYPFRSHPLGMLRVIVLCYVAGMFFYGIIFEYRIWIDITPLLLYPLMPAGKGNPAAEKT